MLKIKNWLKILFENEKIDYTPDVKIIHTPENE